MSFVMPYIQLFFDHPLLNLKLSIARLSYLGLYRCLQDSSLDMVKPLKPRLTQLIINTITLTFSKITSFLIMSNLVCSHIQLIILISATISLYSWAFVIAQHSAHSIRAGLTTILYNLPLSLRGTFLWHKTLKVALNFCHPT